jgi:hypothetical protein
MGIKRIKLKKACKYWGTETGVATVIAVTGTVEITSEGQTVPVQ